MIEMVMVMSVKNHLLDNNGCFYFENYFNGMY
jgi:hypothetical protein